jgi:hypothetical protein
MRVRLVDNWRWGETVMLAGTVVDVHPSTARDLVAAGLGVHETDTPAQPVAFAQAGGREHGSYSSAL